MNILFLLKEKSDPIDSLEAISFDLLLYIYLVLFNVDHSIDKMIGGDLFDFFSNFLNFDETIQKNPFGAELVQISNLFHILSKKK